MDYILKKNGNKLITVRDVQLIILEMMDDIHHLCVENNINYFLEGGSALGAYRHQGFIPWDDDFDIAMLYDDYLKFIKVLDEKLDKNKYIVHCFEKYDKYNVLIPAMKIRKLNTMIKEKNKLLKNKISDSDGIFIDVFIYDYANDNKFKDFIARLFNVLLMPIIILFENININPKLLKNIFTKHARKYGKKNNNSKIIGLDLCWTFNNINKPYRYLYNDIFPLKLTNFENRKYYIANNIENFLKIAIGDNYQKLPDKKYQKPKHIEDIKI